MFPKATRILVVDDMAAMRLRITNQLTAMGFVSIEQAGNGEEAFAMLEKKRLENNSIELIISDWSMPVMTGIDFLEKIKANECYAKLPFIMVTAEGEKTKVIRALKAGVSDYLIKPVDKIVLEQKLLTIWAKQAAS